LKREKEIHDDQLQYLIKINQKLKRAHHLLEENYQKSNFIKIGLELDRGTNLKECILTNKNTFLSV